MPIYTFRCTECGNVFEELVGMKDPNPACPAVIEIDGGHVGVNDMRCDGESVKIPSQVSRPLGGPTPIHFRNRRENR